MPSPDESLEEFLEGTLGREPTLPAASMFSGAAVGDWGFRKAGFRFLTHLEKDPRRAEIIRLNYPDSEVLIGLAEEKLDEFVESAAREGSLRLLSVTPPCAGFSTAGQWKSGSPKNPKPSAEARNLLVLTAAEAVNRLNPTFVFLENVPGFSTRPIFVAGGEPAPPERVFLDRVNGYRAFADLVEMADYGVPQRRMRLVVVLAREDAFSKISREDVFPARTHDREGRGGLERWPRAVDTLAKYNPLDGRKMELARDPKDPLHVVPTYRRMQYDWVSRIPAHSGKSAYEWSLCESCGRDNLPPKSARCPSCHAVIKGRPRIYQDNGTVRLIKGQHTSYRRIPSDQPVPTITTNNGHYGSDTKIHPWQNRVLSVREILDVQTVPADFRWHEDGQRPKVTRIREGAGEAVPPWFTYRVGIRLTRALARQDPPRLSRSQTPRS